MGTSNDIHCELLRTLLRRASTGGPIPRDLVFELANIDDDDRPVARQALGDLLDTSFVFESSNKIQIDQSSNDLIRYVKSNCPGLFALLRKQNP